VLYGCGNAQLLDCGGLAVVGSRHVSDDLIEYTTAVGRLAARAGRMIVSGGAKGVDRSAMRGALEDGGRVCGVLADSLEDAAMNRDNRNFLLDGRLVLISRYDPRAGFNVGNAMQRNKLIYALADAALVVNSDFNKGGTWTGAIEQLERLKLGPVFVRSTGEASAGLEALRKHGALAWPEPRDITGFTAVFEGIPTGGGPELALPLTSNGASVPGSHEDGQQPAGDEQTRALAATTPPSTEARSEAQELSAASPESHSADGQPLAMSGDRLALSRDESSPAESLINGVREVVLKLLTVPMTDSQVAASLNVSVSQARAWLQRFVKEGTLSTRNKPVRYVVPSQASLLADIDDTPPLRRAGTRRR
jgi:predicted Rossmann fold nucleotide-binding protein DprA/Smf involved in DNA uptake